jgi:hypothetical protein
VYNLVAIVFTMAMGSPSSLKVSSSVGTTSVSDFGVNTVVTSIFIRMSLMEIETGRGFLWKKSRKRCPLRLKWRIRIGPSCLCFVSDAACASCMSYVNFCLMKNALRWVNCHAHVTPSTVSWMSVHRTILPLVDSLWSRNSASRSYALSVCRTRISCSIIESQHTLWNTCSLLISCSLPLSSRTFPTMLSILLLSSLSILLVSPIARSSVNLTPPADAPAPENHPPTEIAAGPDGVKHSL